MSGLLQHLSDDFDRRIAVRRHMIAHLGIVLTDDDVAGNQADVRTTLLCCARCSNPEICEGWIRQNRAGTPMFCGARDAFLRLALATERPGKTRLRA